MRLLNHIYRYMYMNIYREHAFHVYGACLLCVQLVIVINQNITATKLGMEDQILLQTSFWYFNKLFLFFFLLKIYLL